MVDELTTDEDIRVTSYTINPTAAIPLWLRSPD